MDSEDEVSVPAYPEELLANPNFCIGKRKDSEHNVSLVGMKIHLHIKAHGDRSALRTHLSYLKEYLLFLHFILPRLHFLLLPLHFAIFLSTIQYRLPKQNNALLYSSEVVGTRNNLGGYFRISSRVLDRFHSVNFTF